MSVVVIAALFLVWIGSQGPVGISPDTLYELGLASERPPSCRPATDYERYGRGEYPQGKAATFSLRGKYYCQRDIFAYDERSLFVTFLTKHAASEAKRVSLLLAHKYKSGGTFATDWSVQVEADDPGIEAYVRSLYVTAMTEALGAGSVRRSVGPSRDVPWLKVVVRRVQDPSLLFEVSAATSTEGGEEQWRDL